MSTDITARGMAAKASGLIHPGYVAGRWYVGGVAANIVAIAASANTIRLYPVMIPRAITISDLGVRITGAVAAQNVQAAFYASDPTTLLPTGAALGSTASISAAATGVFSATLSSPVTLNPGLYWMATNADSSSIAMTAMTTNGNSPGQLGALIGETSAANLLSGSANITSAKNIAQTFGTWPDLTAASLTSNGSTGAAIVTFKAG